MLPSSDYPTNSSLTGAAYTLANASTAAHLPTISHKMLYVTCHCLDNAMTCAKEGETLRYNWPNKPSEFGQGLRFEDSQKWMEHDWQITSVTASAQHKMPAIRGSHRLFEWSGGHAIAINWSPCLCMRTWTDNEFSLARLAKILTWRFQRWVVSLESNQKDLQPWRRLQKQFGGGTKTNRILTDSRVTTCKPSPHWQQKDAKLQSRRLHPCLLISLLLLQCLLDVIPEKKGSETQAQLNI